MTAPVIFDQCPVESCSEKLQASVYHEKWYDQCAFKWNPVGNNEEAGLSLEFRGRHYGDNAEDQKIELYCANDHKADDMSTAIARRYLPPTFDQDPVQLRAAASEMLRQAEALENGPAITIADLDEPATTSRSAWFTPPTLCPDCQRNMDEGELHTADCPSALAQDAADADRTALNGGRCAAQHSVAAGSGTRWVQCALLPDHRLSHIWGSDNQVTPARPFA